MVMLTGELTQKKSSIDFVGRKVLRGGKQKESIRVSD